MPPGPLYLWYGLVSALVVSGLVLAHVLDGLLAWIVLFFALVITAGGTHFLLLIHPNYRTYEHRASAAISWIPPVLLAFAGMAFTKQLLGGIPAIIGVGVTSIGVVALIGCQYTLAYGAGIYAPLARLITTLLLYLSVFLTVVVLQTSDLGLNSLSLFIGSYCGLTAVILFREDAARRNQDLAYALVVGVVMTELSFGLYYVPLGKIYSGLALLVGFYLLAGLAHNYLSERPQHPGRSGVSERCHHRAGSAVRIQKRDGLAWARSSGWTTCPACGARCWPRGVALC